MKQTSNYNLPILEAGDKYLKDYQNDAFSVIDTELKAMNDKINTLDNVDGSILETNQGLKNTNAEIVDARVGQTTLGDKIRNIDTQLDTKANKNEIFTMANMGQDVKEAMTGGAIAVVDGNSVLFNNLGNDLANSFGEYKNIDLVINENTFYDRNNGTLQNFENYHSTKINVVNGDRLKISAIVSGSGTALIVYFNKNNEFVKYEKTVDNGMEEVIDYDVLIGSNIGSIGITSLSTQPIVKKMQVNNFNNSINTIKNELKEVKNTIKNELEEVENNVKNELEEVKNTIKNDKNEFICQNEFNYDGGIVVFIDDDGHKDFKTKLKPVFDSKGVKCTLGVITSKVGLDVDRMSVDDLKELQNEGFEIVSHSKTHSADIFNNTNSSVIDIENEFKESRVWLIDNGFNGDTLIYPYGCYPDSLKYKKIAKKYFKHCVNSGNDNSNTSPYDNMYMNRRFISNEDFETVVKPIIEKAKTDKGILIFGTHSFDSNLSTELLKEMLGYIQAIGMPVLTLGEAIKLKGNILSLGEYTSDKKFFVGRDGTVKM